MLAGKHDDEFPLVVWQTGSGTQTNMNMNEVLANRASELLGGERGEGRLVHPNDDVNKGQSLQRRLPHRDARGRGRGACASSVLPALQRAARHARRRRPRRSRDIVKIGRTHLQDATPLTLGQEFSRLRRAARPRRSRTSSASLPHLCELALGGTAVGTGLNAPSRVRGARGRRSSRELTGLPFVTAPNKFEALAANDALVHAHGALKTLAAVAHQDRQRRALAGLGPALRASARSPSPRTSRAARSCRAR